MRKIIQWWTKNLQPICIFLACILAIISLIAHISLKTIVYERFAKNNLQYEFDKTRFILLDQRCKCDGN